ncbi:MAG TPA: hypothetical protein VHZ09_20715 [Acidobacteriaceae bacterium]|jgi:hypothetical protein|nr:hypothetical protein [Acidobacteriaceae bacterium]
MPLLEVIQTRHLSASIRLRALQERSFFESQSYATATLAERLSHNVSKASAIDLGVNRTTVASVGVEQTAALKKTPGAGLGLSL